MTVGARTGEFPVRGELVRRVVQCAGMSRIQVAVLTEPGPVLYKKFFMIGTVWRMTAQTVFADWRMIPQEGSSLFRMAGVALLVY
jgi:hypothetical protein